MSRRHIPIVTLALVLVAAMNVRAEECSLRGNVRGQDGSPVAGITVTVMTGGFRPSVATGQTQADGTFEIPKAPCGRVRVTVLGAPSPTEADTRQSEAVSLTVPQVAVDYARRMADLRPAQEPNRPLTAEEAEDVRLADDFRARTIAAVGTPADQKAFDASPTPQARAQAFAMFISRWLQREAGFGSPRGASESGAGPREKLVQSFISKSLPDANLSALQNGSPKDRTRMALTASRHWLTTSAWPNTLLLMMGDPMAGPSTLRAIRDVLGPDSDEARGWADHLSPRWRGEAYRKALLTIMKDGLDYVDGHPASQALVRMMAGNTPSNDDVPEMPMRPGKRGPKAEREMEAIRESLRKHNQERARGRDRELVLMAFGAKVADGMGSLPAAESDELRTLAALYTLATSPALFP